MPIRSFAALAVAALAATPALAQPAPTLAQAASFVRSLYAGKDPTFTGAGASKAFDPSTTALLVENARLTPKGKIGALDFSPFCWCQRSTDMTLVIGPARAAGPGAAQVLVRYVSRGEMQTQAQLDLVAVNGSWRVHDIDGMSKEDTKPASMRGILISSNKTLAR